MGLHRLASESIPLPRDDLFDFLVAGASGPPRFVAALNASETAYMVDARRTMRQVLGAPYSVTLMEPKRRIDFLTKPGLLRFRGMLLLSEASDTSSDLTVYLAVDRAGVRSGIYRRRFDGVCAGLERLPSMVDARRGER